MRASLVVLCLLVCLTGCVNTPVSDPGAFPYHAEAQSVGGLRRVVMMPLRTEIKGHAPVDNLETSLLRAITAKHLFELLPVAQNDLADTDFDSTRRQGTYQTEDLITLSRRFGAEGVIHGIVTHYQVFPQIVVGLRLTLLDCRTGQVPWATDLLLDASSRMIEQDVHHYYDTEKWEEGSLLDHEKVLISPRLFGEYASSRIAATLAAALKPRRHKKAPIAKR
ncbi:MAG: hypothetical protein ACI97A_000040 [Planctomycetota bacterium]|jgi:hypothetical protein